MTIESECLTQTAVLWAATADEYDNDGELKRAAATSITVRWSYVQADTLDPQGVAITYDVKAVVAQDIEAGSIMYLGTESDYENASSPMLYTVVSFSKIPDLKGQHFRRVVLLQKYGTELPALIT